MGSSEDIQSLHQKIDHLNTQMEGITSRLKAVDELKEDLALFANDAFAGVIDFLAEVDFHFRSADFLELMKKLLRNVRNLNRVMGQLESAVEWVEDVGPLAKDIFNDFVEKLDRLEKQGVFRSLQALGRVLQTLNERFTPEEVEDMGLRFVEAMSDAKRAVDAHELDSRRKVSLMGLFRKMRRPEVLRNMAMLLDIMGTVSLDGARKETKDETIEEV